VCSLVSHLTDPKDFEINADADSACLLKMAAALNKVCRSGRRNTVGTRGVKSLILRYQEGMLSLPVRINL